MIHTVKGSGVANKAEVNIFLLVRKIEIIFVPFWWVFMKDGCGLVLYDTVSFMSSDHRTLCMP